MELIPLLGRVARGKHGHQHLSRHEAEFALNALIQPEADPLQLGGFLIALRMKGETAEELAGFVDAARRAVDGFGLHTVPDAVDLPCYAGKQRAAPLHLAAAMQARERGIPVLVHGLGRVKNRLTALEALQAAATPQAQSLAEAATMLRNDGIAHIDIANCCPPLAHLLALRPRLGVRSFAHTVARLLNPLQCGGQLNGFFHTPYGAKMAAVNRLLCQPRSLLLMGAEGEPELYADRQKLLLAQIGDDAPIALHYADAKATAYPRESAPPEQLLCRWLQVVAGDRTPREQAVLARMDQAFDFAAGGPIPFNKATTA
ncbi:MAG: anthranilate phosphoribosyltransferase [Mariprofundales bacterium]